MPADRLTQTVRGLRRGLLRRRRVVAAVFAGLAVLSAIRAAAPPPTPTEEVLVASRDLATGTVLTGSDLLRTRLPAGAVPTGVVADAVGRTLAAPVRRGEPVTDVRLVGPGLTAGAAGLVAMPVRLPDAGMVDLLQVGDRIDLLGADPQGSAPWVVARDVRVLAIPQGSQELGANLPGRLVVVGVRAGEVAGIADAAVRAFVSFAYAP